MLKYIHTARCHNRSNMTAVSACLISLLGMYCSRVANNYFYYFDSCHHIKVKLTICGLIVKIILVISKHLWIHICNCCRLQRPAPAITCHNVKPLIGALTPTSPLSIFSQPLNPAETALSGTFICQREDSHLCSACGPPWIIHPAIVLIWSCWLSRWAKDYNYNQATLKNAYGSFMWYCSTKIIRNNSSWVYENLINRLG